MTREELRKKRKEIAESNGYKGYTPRSVENGTRRDITETRNPEPVQEKKSTWANVMNAMGKIGDTMSYIGGGEQNKFNNVNRLVRNDYFTRDINQQPSFRTDRYPFARNNANYGKGNIDLNNRPVVRNEDGSISTERSFSFYDDNEKKEILIPSVIDGKAPETDENGELTEEAMLKAIDHYYETGEYLGKFNTPEEADEYAQELHLQQEERYGKNQQKNTSLQQDIRDQAKIVGQSLKKSGLAMLNYIENATLNNSPQYRRAEEQRGVQKAIQENKPVVTGMNKNGIPTISSDISVTPSKDAINKSMDETEGKIQTLTERQNNPVTRKFSELLPSITQSVTGMGASVINPALRTSILANICWRRLYKTS